jgi:hypothetical protein
MAASDARAEDDNPKFAKSNGVYGELMSKYCSLINVKVQKILTEIKSVSEIFNVLIEEHKHDCATKQEDVLFSTYDANIKTRASKCDKCVQTENQLKDTLNELSTMELITRILSEEIKTLKQTPITDNSWTTVKSRNSHQKIIFQPSKTGHLTHEIPVMNRFAALSNHYESQENSD